MLEKNFFGAARAKFLIQAKLDVTPLQIRFCSAKQMTGFYMKHNSGLKRVKIKATFLILHISTPVT